jgi:hypothetical protein
MEQSETCGKEEKKSMEEWEKPSVKELDVTSITKSGVNINWDGTTYS